MALASPAWAQSRPLVTEDPETVGPGQILLEAGIDYNREAQFPVSGLKGNLWRIGTFGLSHLNNPQSYRADPKILWSVLVWLIYLGLIIMRWTFAQTGRRFALGALGSFVFVLLTFWGTNALSPLHHP